MSPLERPKAALSAPGAEPNSKVLTGPEEPACTSKRRDGIAGSIASTYDLGQLFSSFRSDLMGAEQVLRGRLELDAELSEVGFREGLG